MRGILKMSSYIINDNELIQWLLILEKRPLEEGGLEWVIEQIEDIRKHRNKDED